MKTKFALILLLLMSFSTLLFGKGDPMVTLETTYGDIIIQLNPSKAPISCDNFLTYVKDGFYDGTVFHRVIDGFMIQGGGLTPDLNSKETHSPIMNEASNGLKNKRGTIAMARTMDINSATSQFFINVADNTFLDHTGTSNQAYGYAVFGEVISGMDVVDKIKSVKTTTKGHYQDVPETDVVIKKAIVTTKK